MGLQLQDDNHRRINLPNVSIVKVTKMPESRSFVHRTQKVTHFLQGTYADRDQYKELFQSAIHFFS